MLKQDKVILPSSLIDKALSLAHSGTHSGAHSGQNELIRSLETHFYIKGLGKIVQEFGNKGKFCQLFTQRQQNTQLKST